MNLWNNCVQSDNIKKQHLPVILPAVTLIYQNFMWVLYLYLPCCRVSHVIIYNPHSASVVPHIGVVIYMLPQVVSSIDNLDSAVHDEQGDMQGRIQGEGPRIRRAPGAPPKIGKNMIFLRKIVIFHTKYPNKFRASLRWAQFF